MKENEKRKISSKNQVKRAGKSEISDVKPQQAFISKSLVNGGDNERRISSIGGKDFINTAKGPKSLINSLETRKSKSVVPCPDNYSFESSLDSNHHKITNGHDLNSQIESLKNYECSDSEFTHDHGCHRGDSLVTECDKVKIHSTEKAKCNFNAPLNNSNTSVKCSRNCEDKNFTRASNGSSSHLSEVPSKFVPESSKEREKEIQHKASICSQSVVYEEEENSITKNHNLYDNNDLVGNFEELSARICTLESELRVVAALEFSLYSIVPEHGSSSLKVHTPARRLSRLYIHACKYWTEDKRATISRNIISGLVLIAKSCGNDVPRLTFWLSNVIIIREVIIQVFGNSNQSEFVSRLTESGGKTANGGKFPTVRWKTSYSSKQMSAPCLSHFVEDWQETGTLTTTLEKVESWIFFRIVESIWWQTLTPKMHFPIGDLRINKSSGRQLGPCLVDLHEGNFSANLWKKAFSDAFERLCPVRANGLDCGCLPSLTRLVMEECVARLDVAMFNAILRESVHEIPTDPVSDPIVDSRVLPIPAGDLSFRSGAQLKNTVGKWRGWLTDVIGRQSSDMPDNVNQEGKNLRTADAKCFFLLNALSDLLMLPKDMLVDPSIRKEVCPSIGLVLLKRILCNFTPDEFCPDPVPGVVLEFLNSESNKEGEGVCGSGLPLPAAAVEYKPPPTLSKEVREKVAEVGGGSSFEELEVFEPPSSGGDERYELLRGVLLHPSST